MVYAYIRVSTDEQTVENQKFEITSKGFQVDRWFEDEGVSGTVDYHKRNLNKVLKKLKSGDTLICSEISRLGRSIYMIFEIMQKLVKRNIHLITIKENFRLDDTINSKVILFAFGLSAEIERNLISQRTKEALALRKAQGKVLGRPCGSKNKGSKLDARKNFILRKKAEGKSNYWLVRKLGCSTETLIKWLNVHEKEIQEKIESKHLWLPMVI